MLVFGWLCGVPLLCDLVHDEVFLAGTGLVVLCNGRWCFSEEELLELVRVYKRDGWV